MAGSTLVDFILTLCILLQLFAAHELEMDGLYSACMQRNPTAEEGKTDVTMPFSAFCLSNSHEGN